MRCVTYVAIFVIVSPAALGELEARAAETPNPSTVPEWVRELPENVLTWFETVQHVSQTPEDPWDFFTFSRDSTVPYCVYSTAAAWAIADTCGGNEKLPGYTPDARRQVARFIQALQDPESGQFKDPWLEPRRSHNDGVPKFRGAVTRRRGQCEWKQS